VSPVGRICLLDTLQVSQSGVFVDSAEVMRLELFGFVGGFGELLVEGGEEGGLPQFGFGGGAGVRGGGFNRTGEDIESGGEPKVKLFGEGRSRSGRDLPIFKLVC